MKSYIRQIIALLLLSILATSCNGWLSIDPKTEIKAEQNFKDEQGYKDALTGVYLLLTDQSLYGREMTFGMMDVLAQYYTGIYTTSHSYYYAKLYDYSNSSNVTRINNIWLNMYNAIANLNELIKNIDKADPAMFTGRNYYLIRGEAYGLRAFLHFDLLRMFGPSYVVGADTKAIPYITKVSTSVTALSTVDEVLTKALADLAIAENNLGIDPVVTSNEVKNTYDTTYERDRCFKFNYYASQILKARIYLYKKDYANAWNAAKTVINQSVFYWTPLSEINNTDSKLRNTVFSEELVFTLYVGGLSNIYTSYFTGSSGLYMLEENYDALYQLYQLGLDHDTRYEYQTTQLDDLRFSTKLKQTSSVSAYLFRMPLMRLSEAYYIAAECAAEKGDISQAVNYLNTVRESRQITSPLSESLTTEEVQTEIYKEYAKEFFAEGQLFYYFKRKNYQYIPVSSATGSAVTTSYVAPSYVFPLPDDEIEYGGRTNE